MHGVSKGIAMWAVAWGFASGSLAYGAQARHLATVIDGSGRLSTNAVEIGGTSYRHVTAGAQPGGVARSGSGPLSHAAGFLHAVDIKRPRVDHDGDGAPDELEQDNDADGLTDVHEVEGSSFLPLTPTDLNRADTDGDRVDDYAESVAGTNPTDPLAYLRLTDARRLGPSGLVLEWRARHGKTYEVLAGDTLHRGAPTNVSAVATVNDPGAVWPWYETSGICSNLSIVEGPKFHSVRVAR
jgi:hypothetical protein